MKSGVHFILRFCSLFAIVAILAISLPARAGSGSQPEKVDAYPAVSPFDLGWQEGYYINGATFIVRAVAVDGKNIYISGDFSVAGNVVANKIARWDGAGWHTLNSGVNDSIFALAVDGRGHLYAGGRFSQAGGKPANNIARWDGQTWEALGSGVDNDVDAIAIDACGNVYAGGNFQLASGVKALGIARWDGYVWHPLGDGLANSDKTIVTVNALVVDQFGYVFAGGLFTQADGKPANDVARWDGADWIALGSGIEGELPFTEVWSLAVDDRGKLYVGGEFTSAGGVPAHNLAVWNGENWAEVGGGVESDQTDAIVGSILADGGDLYIGGQFDFAGGSPVGQIAKWNGSTWENMQGGVYLEKWIGGVHSMALDQDGNLVVGGWFSLAGGKNANQVALWNGTDWSALGTDTSVNGNVAAMISDRQGGFYLAGPFIAAGGQVVNHVAHWDGNSWSGLGGGISGGQYGPSARALALDSHGNLYIGGEFTAAGGILANNIAKWVGDHWEALGSGIDGMVDKLVVDSLDNLYVGGLFETAGGVPANHIAKWTGTAWEALGSGLRDPFASLAVDAEDRLVAGGDFETTGGISYNLTRWDGYSWEIIDIQYRGSITTILVNGDSLYLGGSLIGKVQDGNFVQMGGRISNGEEFTYVNALALDEQGRLVAAGQFTQAGDAPANNIARWDGDRWEPLGSGTEGTVNALLIDEAGNLLVAGEFNQAGGKASTYLARWQDPFAAWAPVILR